MINFNNPYILAGFPSVEEMEEALKGVSLPEYREVNAHIHTPFSFSAFSDMQMIFGIARSENIAVLGINDFYVADGYSEFYEGCLNNGIFPLFNIEFIGLIKEYQEKGIRINDPNNPGRIYFCGKGLDYPFHLNGRLLNELAEVRLKTQEQVGRMVDKLNVLIGKSFPDLRLSFDEIKRRFAKELVRERHLAKAVRMMAIEHFASPQAGMDFIETLYGGSKSKFGMDNPAALENEIRGNLLKAGGPAFVEEDENSFLAPQMIIEMIKDAGGLPCYPVLLDDISGNFTEFEKDFQHLYENLSGLGTSCIELIPGRNDHDILRKFAGFFYEKGFVVTFGTEHNTPVLEPLKVMTRGGREPDSFLKTISWKGACVIAAHQYLRSHGQPGYALSGKPAGELRAEYEKIGEAVIEYYLKRVNR